MKSSPISAVVVKCFADAKKAISDLPGNVLFWATNYKAFQDCVATNQPTIYLNEEILGDEYAELNDWSYRESISFINEIKTKSTEKQKIFFESNFYALKGILVQSAKYITVLERILKKHPIEAIYFPEDQNSLLYHTFTIYLADVHPQIKIHRLEKCCPSLPQIRFGMMLIEMRRFLAAILNEGTQLLLRFPLRKSKKIILSGALGHLRLLVKELKSQKIGQMVFWEKELDFRKFLFCLSNGIPYITSLKQAEFYDPFFENETTFKECRIFFMERDLTHLFLRLFSVALKNKIMKFGYNLEDAKVFFKQSSVVAVILDEDLSLERRLLSVLATINGIDSYVMSHGMPLQRLRRSSKNLSFRSAFTIVHSLLEQKVYERLYFDPNSLLLLGIPRYDEIFKMRSEVCCRKQRDKTTKTVTLFLSSFEDYNFESFMTVLVGADSLRKDNQRYIKDVIDALNGRKDVFLIIKPHFIKEKKIIAAYIKTLHPSVRYKIESHKANAFRLERDADIIVTPESTVVAEAILFEKPVLVITYRESEIDSPFSTKDGFPFFSKGEFLRENLQNLLEDSVCYEAAIKRCGQYRVHFEQFHDDCATKRVVQYIVNRIKATYWHEIAS